MLFYAFFSLLVLNRRFGLVALTVWFAAVAWRLDYTGSGGRTFTDVL